MTVDRGSLVLMNASPDVENATALVIAQFVTEGGAQAMFRAIEQRIRLGATLFDARRIDPSVQEMLPTKGLVTFTKGRTKSPTDP